MPDRLTFRYVLERALIIERIQSGCHHEHLRETLVAACSKQFAYERRSENIRRNRL